MSTIIYPSPIFGPVHSRRLGISLGINLQPGDGKRCTFDCIYCECGFNGDFRTHSPRPSRHDVAVALEAQLRQMAGEGTLPDVLTFAGNGEPTAHPQFQDIIDDTLRLRDRWAPKAKVSVLSNATMIGLPGVREALMKVDKNILKLDTVDPEYIRRVDRPVSAQYDVNRVVDDMMLFKGHLFIQTMFMTGTTLVDGKPVSVDNTGEDFVTPWLKTVCRVAPRGVMIYTVDRETPDPNLRKASPETLDAIRDRVIAAGIPCTASY